MTKVGTTRMAQMATWPRWGLPEWPRWLNGQDGDYQSGLDNYMAKVGYQSGPDDYMADIGTTRVAKMAT